MMSKTKKDILFVGIQVVLFLAFILEIEIYFLPQIVPDFILGLLLAIAIAIFVFSIFELKSNLSPFPSPKQKSNLVTSGIFKFIRHPIYTALILALLSWSLYQHSLYQICISIVLIGLFYFKSIYEEQLLAQKFEEYMTYKQNTGRFFPKLF